MTKRLVKWAAKRWVPLALKQHVSQTAYYLTRNPMWAYRLASFQRRRGHIDQARLNYELALREGSRIAHPALSKARQQSQFLIEQSRFLRGEPCAADPLFHCSVLADTLAPSKGPFAKGAWDAQFNYLGLVIHGRLEAGPRKTAAPDTAEILIDGTPVRRVNLQYEGGIARFSFTIKRPTVARLPARAEVAVRTSAGLLPLSRVGTTVTVLVPHGSGDIQSQVEERGLLDKKGYLSLSAEEVRARQDAYLELYGRARDAFEAAVGRPLFLMYGTLLGLYRSGDFIPGDDDFDVGYVSEETDALAAKTEVKKIILNLVRAGFTVVVNRRGKPFRLKDPAGGIDLHLDARPLWQEGGRVWAHKQACLPLSLDSFRRVETRLLRGTRVYIPAGTEAFLEAYYGPGWRVPDPTYSNASAVVAPEVKGNLRKNCLSPLELRDLQSLLTRERASNPAMGRLIAIGSHDLYPLDEYEQHCGF